MKYHLFVFHRSTDAMAFESSDKVYKGSFDTLALAMDYQFSEDDIVGDMREARAYLYETDGNGAMKLAIFAYCSARSPFGSWYRFSDR